MNKRVIVIVALTVLALVGGPLTAQARYLNPNTGRFQTMDSYEGNNQDTLSLHKYLYAQGNPVNRVDPSGFYTVMETEAAATIGLSAETLELVGLHAIRQGLVTGTSGLILKAGAVAIITTVAVPTVVGTSVAMDQLLKDPSKKPKLLFRAMVDAEDGAPIVSNDDGQFLGIRARDVPNKRQFYDIEYDVNGFVHSNTGGLSVTPGDPSLMVAGVLRRVDSGDSAIYAIFQDILPPVLQVRPTSPSHSLIEPASDMPLEAYRAAIVATRPFWVKVTR